MNLKVKEVLNYYDCVDSNAELFGGLEKKTDVGLFVPSYLTGVANTLDEGKKYFNNFLKSPFLDAGSGDGRIVALALALGFDNAFGIEYDSLLVQESQTHLENLFGKKKRERIIKGDFTEINSISNFSFKDFKIFFNYMNNELSLTQRINEDSSPRTIFLYNGVGTASFDGFKKIDELNLGESIIVYEKE